MSPNTIVLVGVALVVLLGIVLAGMAAGRANRAAEAAEAKANADRAATEERRETNARNAQTVRENAERQARADLMQAQLSANVQLAQIRVDAQTTQAARESAERQARADERKDDANLVADVLSDDSTQEAEVTVGGIRVRVKRDAKLPKDMLAAVELGHEAWRADANGGVTHFRPAKAAASTERTPPPPRAPWRKETNRSGGSDEPVAPVSV